MAGKKHPRKIGSIVNQLMARRGYAQVHVASEIEQLFVKTMGAGLAKHCTPGKIRGGVLEVAVSNSVAAQEVTFKKRKLIKALQKEFPQSKISDIRFRVG